MSYLMHVLVLKLDTPNSSYRLSKLAGNPAVPSLAALAMSTMSVMLGVILAKNGILTAALTHLQISRTNLGFYSNRESSEHKLGQQHDELCMWGMQA